MANARELLEQADALMRRNRRRGKDRLDASTLTGVVEARTQADEPSTLLLPDTPRVEVDGIVLGRDESALHVAPEAAAVGAAPGTAEASPDDEMSLDTLADLPVLTDVVGDWLVSEALSSAPSDAADESGALRDAFPASAAEAEAVHAPAIAIIERQVEAAPAEAIEAPGPVAVHPAGKDAATDGSAGVVASEPSPAPFLEDDFILEIPPLDAARTAAAAPPPIAEAASPDDGTAWAALAEELRMQVLQRLDLFTDTGLRDQLGERLSPIVERASTQMIETINRELGELVRAYVAEAIEREIETWRNRSDRQDK